MTHQPLDSLPIIVLVALFVAINVVVYEIGYQIGKWGRRRGGEDAKPDEGPTGIIVGAILGLMAFLLAITMGMASDRFDARRALVVEETNAIGTTYLRAGYLDEPAGLDMRDLLREYVPLRIATSDEALLVANLERSEQLLDDMWAIAEDVARAQPSDVTALFIESLNEVIDLHTSRFVAGVYSRVPPTILLLLVAGVILSLGLVGYNAGLSEKRSPIIAIVLVIALGATLWLVIDLDRPREGLIQTSQQPLIDLQQKLGTSSQ
jgi:hypothetical protein